MNRYFYLINSERKCFAECVHKQLTKSSLSPFQEEPFYSSSRFEESSRFVLSDAFSSKSISENSLSLQDLEAAKQALTKKWLMITFLENDLKRKEAKSKRGFRCRLRGQIAQLSLISMFVLSINCVFLFVCFFFYLILFIFFSFQPQKKTDKK